MDIQHPIPFFDNQIQEDSMIDQICKKPLSPQPKQYPKYHIKQSREKQQKINKIQQIGCNCRKSKCLKMYCQCFHLQVFCNQNCNCLECGNLKPNQCHQEAVIEALVRNPKAFDQQNPQIEGSFKLGVGLMQVKKGCRCKKTKCQKKYCQCFNSGHPCGKFCKCQSCQNCQHLLS